MKKLSSLFCFLLIFHVFSIEVTDDQAKYMRDTQKCKMANNYGTEVTLNQCTSITPSFEAGGDYKSECCKIIANWDILHSYKVQYHENWKKMVCQLFRVDESISEEELRNVVYSNQLKNQCEIYQIKSKSTTLYSDSLLTIDGKIQYNCGDGENTFYSEDFHPVSDVEILAKDIIDCNVQYLEKSCYKQGNKNSSGLSQCCWCETKYLTQELSSANSQVCIGFNTDLFKESITNMKNVYDNSNLKLEYSCKCENKNGVKLSASFNTVNGDLSFN